MDKALVLADRLKKLKDQVDSLATKQTEIQTIKGDQGPKGEQGDRGFDGAPGLDGRDGKDGKDGAEGKDGISVVKAEIAFDGSLVLYLSNGDQIDCGEVTPEKSKEVFQTIKNSGGSSPINIFTAVLPGLVPASGGGTTNFLRADGSFAAPPSGSPASPTTSVQFNDAGAFGGSANFTYNTGTNILTVGPAGSNVNSTITTVAPTGSIVAGILRLLGTNASATNGIGGGITLTTGNGTGTQRGGNFILTSGAGGSTGNGGNMTLTSGTGRQGGNFSMSGGFGSNTTGGSFSMAGGEGGSNGGSFTLGGGNGELSGGDVTIRSGSTFGGSSGAINISAGQGSAGYGRLTLQQGAMLAEYSGGGDDPVIHKIGFFDVTPVVKPVVTGSRASGAALVSLLTQLASLGLITDSTTA